MLRFLRARNFNPVKAEAQFAQSQQWRTTNKVSQLYEQAMPEDMHNARRFYPRWTGRRDKDGLPIFVYKISALAPDLVKELNSMSKEKREKDMVALYEHMCLFNLRLCSVLPSPRFPQPICCTTNIIDLQGVSLSLIWSLRSHLQTSVALASTNYPETIHRIFVVNAPSFFPTVWTWIKGFFDEGTQRKVYVLGNNPGADMLKHIDASSLSKDYGGELDFSFLDDPSLDEHAQAAIGSETFIEGPNVFVGEALDRGKVVHWKHDDRERLQPQNEDIPAASSDSESHANRDASDEKPHAGGIANGIVRTASGSHAPD